jgi:hypothetical protein
MVYKIKKWFIFEPCDQVLSLVTGTQGYILESKSLDIQSQTQFVDILFKNGLKENVDAQELELVKRVPFRQNMPCG